MFKEGDIVVGTHTGYDYTGMGSICRVTRIYDSERINVEVMTPAPSPCSPGERWDVKAIHFRLRDDATKPMKIEPLKVFTCQHALPYGEECSEVAEHRLIIPGLAVTLCGPHAHAYIKGAKTLEAIMCTQCGQTCKPGYRLSRDYGRPFCNEACENVFRFAREGGRAYTSATY